jgi:hypothetical protein
MSKKQVLVKGDGQVVKIHEMNCRDQCVIERNKYWNIRCGVFHIGYYIKSLTYLYVSCICYKCIFETSFLVTIGFNVAKSRQKENSNILYQEQVDRTGAEEWRPFEAFKTIFLS